MIGTNPIAIAVPAGNAPPFLIDIATSTGSFGAIKALEQSNRPIPRDG